MSVIGNTYILVPASSFNPLMGTLKPQSNEPLYSNMVTGTLAVDGWAVIFRTTRRGLGGLWPRPVPSSLYQMQQPTQQRSVLTYLLTYLLTWLNSTRALAAHSANSVSPLWPIQGESRIIIIIIINRHFKTHKYQWTVTKARAVTVTQTMTP